MSIVHPATSASETISDETWIADLIGDGPTGHAARQRLHELLLRATRHQVYRLRSQLPGAGSVDLEDLAQQSAGDALVAVLGKLDTFEGREQVLDLGVQIRTSARGRRGTTAGVETSRGAAVRQSRSSRSGQCSRTSGPGHGPAAGGGGSDRRRPDTASTARDRCTTRGRGAGRCAGGAPQFQPERPV